jgi:RIO kinase 1
VAFGPRIIKRIEHKERATAKTPREKDEEDYQVLEEVFDKSTLMVIYRLLNRGVLSSLHGVVKSGKESRIYRGLSSSGESLAVKIYLTVSAEFRRGMLPYLEGDPRFNSIKRDSRSLVYAWAQKEFKNLQKAVEGGVRVPKPVAVDKNVLVMEFIGDGGVPAPTLREEPPKRPSAMYKLIMASVRSLYCNAGLVHGDLSEYNVMNYRGRPVLFDLSQAVLREHPKADELLRRDLGNINRFFSKLGVDVKSVEYLHGWVTRCEHRAPKD